MNGAWTIGAMILTDDSRNTWRNISPVPLCTPRIPHGLTWYRNQASELICRHLTVTAIAQREALAF